jgi:hypothetical protein
MELFATNDGKIHLHPSAGLVDGPVLRAWGTGRASGISTATACRPHRVHYAGHSLDGCQRPPGLLKMRPDRARFAFPFATVTFASFRYTKHLLLWRLSRAASHMGPRLTLSSKAGLFVF